MVRENGEVEGGGGGREGRDGEYIKKQQVRRTRKEGREHERPWLMAFEPLLRTALNVDDVELFDAATNDLALSTELVEQGG